LCDELSKLLDAETGFIRADELGNLTSFDLYSMRVSGKKLGINQWGAPSSASALLIIASDKPLKNPFLFSPAAGTTVEFEWHRTGYIGADAP
jgi:hypothetical protein